MRIPQQQQLLQQQQQQRPSRRSQLSLDDHLVSALCVSCSCQLFKKAAAAGETVVKLVTLRPEFGDFCPPLSLTAYLPCDIVFTMWLLGRWHWTGVAGLEEVHMTRTLEETTDTLSLDGCGVAKEKSVSGEEGKLGQLTASTWATVIEGVPMNMSEVFSLGVPERDGQLTLVRSDMESPFVSQH